MSPLRYNAYGPWLKQAFGNRVSKVSVDGGFTCPNRDGTVATGGCTYCNNDSFRPAGVNPRYPVEEQVQRGISYLSRRFNAQKFLIYWQNYTNTYAPAERLRSLYVRSLAADARIVGMTIGTRPDCVEEEKLSMIEEVCAGRYVCIEYGLESIHDSTLRRVNRGHDFACYVDAVARTQRRRIAVCAHIILGFPYESLAQMKQYAAVLNWLGVDFVKIHHLHVVRHTALAREYEVKPFHTFSCEEWVDFVCDFLELLEPGVVVQRLFGWAPDKDLIAPRWKQSRAEILLSIHRELERRDSWQGKKLGKPWSPAAHVPDSVTG
ncbi:MAG: TIGR01212 family radical SAM protein [Acidobacteria bacterium]|nr:TIGR01212 family radical SAM protein [Acidobacteriota bacterium]